MIFRGIQVVAWADRIEVRYQLGLSDNMLQQELQALLPEGEEPPGEPGQNLRRYAELLFPALPQQMAVSIDGQPQQLVPRRVLIVRLPHVQLELVYRIEFAADDRPAHFVLIDDNFQGVPGYHLAAAKARGEVDLLDSTAAIVLSRLSRIPETDQELETLSTPVRRVEALFASRASASAPPSVAARSAPLTTPGEEASEVGQTQARAPSPSAADAAERDEVPPTGRAEAHPPSSPTEGGEESPGTSPPLSVAASQRRVQSPSMADSAETAGSSDRADSPGLGSGRANAATAAPASEQTPRYLWHLLGGLAMLVAAFWTMAIIRRG